MPNPALFQANPAFKKKTSLKYVDANYSPVSITPSDVSPFYITHSRFFSATVYFQEEKRAYHPKYYFAKNVHSAVDIDHKMDTDAPPVEEPRAKKRARAEDFL
jgi:hypothetical protein